MDELREKRPSGKVTQRYEKAAVSGSQRGKYACSGKAHGGMCREEPHKIALPVNRIVCPPSCYKFLHCTCAEETCTSMAINLDTFDEENHTSWNKWRHDNVFNRSFYTGRYGITLSASQEVDKDGVISKVTEEKTFYPGADTDGYKFTRCLYNKQCLWFIENKKGELILPREAQESPEEAKVFVNWPLISMFAQRHLFREEVIADLRTSPLDWHNYQTTHLTDFHPLRVTKSTPVESAEAGVTYEVGFEERMSCWMNFSQFRGLLHKNTIKGRMHPKNLRLVENGRESRGLAVKVGGVFTNWKKEVDAYENLAKEQLITGSRKKELEKRGFLPQTSKEKVVLKHFNCLLQCFEECSFFLGYERPGICPDCVLGKMLWMGLENPDNMNKSAASFSSQSEGNSLFHQASRKKGHFHSIAIASELIDRATEFLVQRFARESICTYRQIWDDLKLRIAEHNIDGSQEKALPFPLNKEAKSSTVCDIRLSQKKLRSTHDAPFFLLNCINSVSHALLHFPTWVKSEDEDFHICAPLWCNELEVKTLARKRIKAPATAVALYGKKLRNCVEKKGEKIPMEFSIASDVELKVWRIFPWKREHFNTIKCDSVLKFGGSEYELRDTLKDFPSVCYFVATTNKLFTLLLPENLNYSFSVEGASFVSKNEPALSGDLLTFDGKVVIWCHFDDTDRAFLRGAIRVARSASSITLPSSFFHSADNVYLSDGRVLPWCPRMYHVDTSKIIMSKKRACDLDIEVTLKGDKSVCDYIPYQLKLMFLSMDSVYKADIFCETLLRPECFDKCERHDTVLWDLKPELKSLFEDLGFNWVAGSQAGDDEEQRLQMKLRIEKMKRYPRQMWWQKHVQKYHLRCATVNAALLGKSILVRTGNLPSYSKRFLHGDTFVRIFYANGFAHAETCGEGCPSIYAEDDEGIRTMHDEFPFYYCRDNFCDGTFVRRRPRRSLVGYGEKADEEKDEVYVQDYFFSAAAFEMDNFSLFKDILQGSEEVFKKSKCFLPSLHKWQAGVDEEKNAYAANSVPFKFFNHMQLIPRCSYVKKGQVAFSDLFQDILPSTSLTWHRAGEIIPEVPESEEDEDLDMDMTGFFD